MIRNSHTEFGAAVRDGHGLRFLFVPVMWLFLPVSSVSGQVFARGALTGSLPTQVAYFSVSVPMNPAYLGVRSGTVATTWIAQMYELPDLRLYGVAARVDLPLMGLGVRIIGFGFDRFTEERLELSAGRTLSTDAMAPGIGLGFLFKRQSADETPNNMSLLVRAGIHLPVTTIVRLGIIIERALGSLHSTDSILMGVGFRVSEQITVFSDVYLERYYPVSFRSGVEASMGSHISIRGGFSTHPNGVSLGISIPLRQLTVHLGFNRHDLLGWSTAVELSFSL